MVEALSSRYLGPDYSTPSTKAGVRVADVDALAAASFPLCMQHLLHKVRDDHHLKHGGRQQLGLFLKVSDTRRRLDVKHNHRLCKQIMIVWLPLCIVLGLRVVRRRGSFNHPALEWKCN